MVQVWSESLGGGLRVAPSVQRALSAVREGLSDARSELLAAGQVEWVSAAADLYRALLTDALGDVARLGTAHGSACAAVVRHVTEADAARAAVGGPA